MMRQYKVTVVVLAENRSDIQAAVDAMDAELIRRGGYVCVGVEIVLDECVGVEICTNCDRPYGHERIDDACPACRQWARENEKS